MGRPKIFNTGRACISAIPIVADKGDNILNPVGGRNIKTLMSQQRGTQE